MSVIAVRITENTIEIAGDSQTSWGNHKLPKQDVSDAQTKAYGKIWQTNGMTFGCAGSCAHIGLLQIFAKTHKPKEMEKDFIMDWFMEFREWLNSKAKIGWNELCLHAIIIDKGRAFTFYDFMDINEIKSFDSVGSGMWLAIGAMEIGANVEDAVRVASKYDKGCGGETTKLSIPKNK